MIGRRTHPFRPIWPKSKLHKLRKKLTRCYSNIVIRRNRRSHVMACDISKPQAHMPRMNSGPPKPGVVSPV